ncbi:MAG: type II toxin-antitoxin system RelE/ParE family toxin [Thermoleophilia bacterium]|nr:type II toxin-antitoxin system RelE/ParE family toxin [Thermoleophilia bacterium]
MTGPFPKKLVWIASSLDDLKEFPTEIRQVIGYALFLAQMGDKHPSAKPLRGHRGAGVLEVAEEYLGDAFRVVYTVGFPSAVYVLHGFKKKSNRGVATPKRHMEVIEARLQQARRLHLQTCSPPREKGV